LWDPRHESEPEAAEHEQDRIRDADELRRDEQRRSDQEERDQDEGVVFRDCH
jgi:hypothetical protein